MKILIPFSLIVLIVLSAILHLVIHCHIDRVSISEILKWDKTQIRRLHWLRVNHWYKPYVALALERSFIWKVGRRRYHFPVRVLICLIHSAQFIDTFRLSLSLLAFVIEDTPDNCSRLTLACCWKISSQFLVNLYSVRFPVCALNLGS